MREILFRGKRKDNEEWVYGFYYKDYTVRNCIKRDYHAIFDKELEEWFEVVPETVGQYTGITAQDSEKVFEGDIVKTKQYGKDNGSGVNFNNFDIFAVIWKHAGYYLENSLRIFNLTSSLRNSITEPLEVIGNVHDNHELLGGEK